MFEAYKKGGELFDRIVYKAVGLFKDNEFDDDGEAMDASRAWAWALEKLIKTDEDALALVTDILQDLALKNEVNFWEGEYDDFCGFIRMALYGNEGFAQIVADKIMNYDQIMAERKQRVA